MLLIGGIAAILSKFSFGRNLLIKHPQFFTNGFITHEGPSEDTQNKTKYTALFHGRGWSNEKQSENIAPDKTIITKVSTMNPGKPFEIQHHTIKLHVIETIY